MRELVRAKSEEELKQKINRMVGRGWKQISDIKIDDSMLETFNEFDYVAVMENEEKQNTGRKWGKTYHLR